MENNIIFPSIKGSYAKMNINLVFPDRISFLYGDSGNGKTFLAKALAEQDILVEAFDYKYVRKEKKELIKDVVTGKKGFLIVIDNADIVLDDELRELICEDKDNQFLIIGRDPRNLFLSRHNFVDIQIEGNEVSFKEKF